MRGCVPEADLADERDGGRAHFVAIARGQLAQQGAGKTALRESQDEQTIGKRFLAAQESRAPMRRIDPEGPELRSNRGGAMSRSLAHRSRLGGLLVSYAGLDVLVVVRVVAVQVVV